MVVLAYIESNIVMVEYGAVLVKVYVQMLFYCRIYADDR